MFIYKHTSPESIEYTVSIFMDDLHEGEGRSQFRVSLSVLSWGVSNGFLTLLSQLAETALTVPYHNCRDIFK